MTMKTTKCAQSSTLVPVSNLLWYHSTVEIRVTLSADHGDATFVHYWFMMRVYLVSILPSWWNLLMNTSKTNSTQSSTLVPISNILWYYSPVEIRVTCRAVCRSGGRRIHSLLIHYKGFPTCLNSTALFYPHGTTSQWPQTRLTVPNHQLLSPFPITSDIVPPSRSVSCVGVSADHRAAASFIIHYEGFPHRFDYAKLFYTHDATF